MKAKKVFENIDFKRGLDPRESLGLGKKRKYEDLKYKMREVINLWRFNSAEIMEGRRRILFLINPATITEKGTYPVGTAGDLKGKIRQVGLDEYITMGLYKKEIIRGEEWCHFRGTKPCRRHGYYFNFKKEYAGIFDPIIIEKKKIN